MSVLLKSLASNQLFRNCSITLLKSCSSYFSSLAQEVEPDQFGLQLPPFDYVPKPYNGPSAEQVLKIRKDHMSEGVFHYYQKPVMIVEGKQQYLFDETGRIKKNKKGGKTKIKKKKMNEKFLEAESNLAY
eukprot:TRINITY_DN5342_c0_g1_i6.p1 TRINITY_DN5342_c0_g1~~TRINITY_DN5342_c0_g1_i6.p1  ORF type:complete len:141 (-),score=10.52 TRINITY_DN5342_c0_g1_i6:7-396(-)